ncbi:hypothetical protein CPB85DRAFT_1427445 [Mucidula mucida]|nr:hypothetical protein CPB85DRAFT_1427445 [Mucidula mucida]
MFQHFKLTQLAMHQPLPPHLLPQTAGPSASAGPTDYASNSFSGNPPNTQFSSSSGTKQPYATAKPPYGSGTDDDGYNLRFETLDAFQAWQIEQSVEFVKGDTHGSKADPPRFKEHTKLVCARHSRSGRKKYIKNIRILEGVGCSASISFKTYFETDEVRASYNPQHSHPIGPENFPFTRRGRKAAVQEEKERPRKYQKKDEASATPSMSQPPPPTQFIQQPQPVQPQPQQQQQHHQVAVPVPQALPPNQFTSNVSMIAPLPQHPQHAHTQYQPQPQAQYAYVPQGYPMAPMPDAQMQPTAITQDRWQNMQTLFNAIREHSRGFNYPFASVIALESVLIRLFLESPVSLQAAMTPSTANGVAQPGSTSDNGQAGPSTNNQPHESDTDGSEDSS